jgi:hypothetical protein
MGDVLFARLYRGYRGQARQRKRRTGYRAGSEGDQRDFVIIARDAVGVDRPAGAAAMENRPVAAGSCPDGYWFHAAPAVGGPVARFLVHMPTPQTPGAVVPMLCPERFRDDRVSAMNAVKPFGFVVAAGRTAPRFLVMLQRRVLL